MPLLDGGPVVTAEFTEPDLAEVDVFASFEDRAIEALANDSDIVEEIRTSGCPWGKLNVFFERHLPDVLEDRHDSAFRLVPKAMDRVFGDQSTGGWHTFKHPTTGRTWIKAGAV